MRTVSFTLNGRETRVTSDDTRMLLWILRDDLGLTGTKFGCGITACGACTVVVNDEAVRACATPIGAIDGQRVVTIEGLAREDRLHPVQEAFIAEAAFQCGYCTPGMIMTAYALLAKHPAPTRRQIVDEMDQHLCRCGAHLRIARAIEHAAAATNGGAL